MDELKKHGESLNATIPGTNPPEPVIDALKGLESKLLKVHKDWLKSAQFWGLDESLQVKAQAAGLAMIVRSRCVRFEAGLLNVFRRKEALSEPAFKANMTSVDSLWTAQGVTRQLVHTFGSR